jgi:hypothetical protein
MDRLCNNPDSHPISMELPKTLRFDRYGNIPPRSCENTENNRRRSICGLADYNQRCRGRFFGQGVSLFLVGLIQDLH